MKTAIIKTEFWKEDKIFELLPDARYFYLCLLTNPERNGTAAFKCSDRLLVAYTGYNVDTIAICKAALVDKGLIELVEGYYIINEQDYVQPTKGKLTSQLYEKDYSSLPLAVQEKLLSGSGATPECISISNSKSNSISKSNGKKELPEQAIQLATLLQDRILQNFEFVKPKDKDIQNWAGSIEAINRLDGYDWELIRAVIEWSQQDNFWKKNIRSGHKLRQQFTTLLVNVKTEQDNKKVTVY